MFGFAAGLAGWIASYLVPGWLILRACRLAPNLAAAFIVSAACIYCLSISLLLLGVRFALLSVGLPLLGLCAALLYLRPDRAASRIDPAPPDRGPPAAPRWLRLAVFLFVTLFVWRAFAQPLIGPDTSFRWNHLALELAAERTLEFYPPATPADFERYFHADGFPPFVAIQYAWTYLLFDSTSPAFTGLLVGGQWIATLMLVAACVSGTSSLFGALAATAVASSGLVFWSYHCGQETGWIASSLACALWCWKQAAAKNGVLASLASALAILPAMVAREYGPAFLLVGVAFGARAGANRGGLLLFSACAIALASPWYVHAWSVSGNPFYSVSFFNLFPTNQTVSEYFSAYRERFGVTRQEPGLLLYRAADVALRSPLLAVAAVAALWRWKQQRHLLLSAGLVLVLWFVSVGYTSGGMHIANRVLAPACVLIAIAGALAVATERPQFLQHRVPKYMIGAALAWGVYTNSAPPSGLRLLDLRQTWSALTRVSPPATPDPLFSAGEEPSFEGRILSDDAYLHAEQRRAKAKHPLVPYWMPELRGLFSSAVSEAEAVRLLVALDIGAVHLPPPTSPNWAHWQRHRFFREIAADWRRIPNGGEHDLRAVPRDPAPQS